MTHGTEAYLALGVPATVYAGALNTDLGKRFAREYTWASVVFGTSPVLAILRFILPKQYWDKVMLAFAVAGAPMIGRSLLNKLSESGSGDA